MLRWTTSLFMFVSGYTPLFLLLAIKDVPANEWSPRHPVLVSALLFSGLLSTFLTFVSIRQLHGQFTMKVTRIANRSSEITNYTLPYILSFVGYDLSSWQNVVSLALLFVLLFVLSVRTQSVLLNPFLALAGYGLYDVEFDENGTAKNGVALARVSPHIGGTFEFVMIAKYLSLVTKEAGNE